MHIVLSPSGDYVWSVTIAQRLFLHHLSHVIGVKVARRLCLRLGVTTATANILNGSLQPKLKGANVWPFNACAVKLLQAESVIYDHCTSNVKRKLIKLNCSDIYGNFYVPRPGQAGY